MAVTTNIQSFAGDVDITSNLAVNTNDLFVNSLTGRVGIGSTVPSYDLDVDGDIYSTGNITAFSDLRGKDNITRIEDALDKLSTLSGYTYNLKTSGERSTGLIAQEVLKILPEAVVGSEETNYALSYGNMMGLVVEAIKDLKREIEEIKNSQ